LWPQNKRERRKIREMERRRNREIKAEKGTDGEIKK
jgi:hypothetical protein